MTPLPDTVTFTTNADEHGSLALSGDWRADLADAVREDHYCDDAHCDIREANEADFPVVAAYLLDGATEAPALTAVHAAYEAAGAIPEGEHFADPEDIAEWDDWKVHFDEFGRACPSCGSFTFATSTHEPTDCANCGAPLGRDYVIAVIYHVRATNGASAMEKIGEGEGEALFGSNAHVATEEDVVDPDFDITIRSHGRDLEPIPADEENER